MFWSKRSPLELPDYYCQLPTLPIKRQELNSKSLLIVGARNSGKSTLLSKSIIHKSDKENALVLCTYATERKFWNNIIKSYNITKTVIHTPDSLARYLLSLWAKKEGKKLEWVLEKEVAKSLKLKSTPTSKQDWHDERGYALWLLKRGKMTAGIAHWLLSEEITNFVENKMLPNLDMLCVDEPEEWEPEAQKWLQSLPRTRTMIATKSQKNSWNDSEEIRNLWGSYDWQGKLSNYRHLKIIPKDTILNSKTLTQTKLKLKENSCIICQNTIKHRMLKEIAKASKSEVRTAEQIKGRKYTELLIESMPTNVDSVAEWGKRIDTLNYLDLIASRGKAYGFISHDDLYSYLPLRGNEEKFLTWRPQSIQPELVENAH